VCRVETLWRDFLIQASFYVYGSWETVAGTVTSLGLDNRGIVVRFLVGREHFSLLQSIRTLWPTQPPADCLSRASWPGVKWLGNEAGHLLSSRADIKIDWNYSSTTPYAFRARREMTLPFMFYVCDGYWPGYLSQYIDSFVTGWRVLGSNPGGGARFFASVQTGPWARPPSFLYNGYRVFPRGKTARPWRWPTIPSISEVKDRVELHLLSFWDVMACSMANVMFSFFSVCDGCPWSLVVRLFMFWS
jgi:hypothetical protein